MKNLKRLLGLMAISGFAFGFAGNVKAASQTIDACSSVSGANFYAKAANGADGCYSGLTQAMENSNGQEVILLKDFTLAGGVNVSENLTLNLNGHTLDINTRVINVENGKSLTIKNGGITTTNTATFLKVNGSTSDNTSLTVANDVTVTASSLAAAPIEITNGDKVTLNIAGTWNIGQELISEGTSTLDKAATINLSATVTTANAGSVIKATKASTTWNITNGTYTATNGDAIVIEAGNVKISGGKVIATTGGAALLIGDSANNGGEINLEISGGNFTAVANDQYAIEFANAYAEEAVYAITGGTFTSGKSSTDSKVLPAIVISDEEFLDNHPAIISGGTFKSSVVGSVKVGDNLVQNADNATKILVGNSTTTKKTGSVVVTSNTQTTEPTPGDQTQTPGDDTPDKNVQTYDGILSYVTLAISSLGALGFATKKVLF